MPDRVSEKRSLVSLRRTSRTHWPLPRVLLYVAAELAVAGLLGYALVWLLAHS